MKSNIYRLILLLSISLHFFSSVSAEDREIKIGVLAPLTGEYASAGEHIRQGIELAKETLQPEGIKVKVYFEDACLPADGVRAYKKLTSVDNIDGIASNYCVITLAAIKNFIEKDQLPTMHNSVYPAEMLESSKYIFSTWPAIDDEVAQMANYMIQTVRAKRVGIVSLQSPWGEGYKESFKKLFPLQGGSVAGIETTGFGISDFRSELTRIKGKNPEALLLAQTGSPLAEILKQTRRLGMTVPAVVSSDADDETIVKAAGDAAEGMTLFSTQNPVETKEQVEFGDKFKKKFQETPTPMSQHAYDQLMIVARALKACDLKRECVPGKISTLGNYKGVSGEFGVDEKGRVKREFYRKEVVRGEIEFVGGK